MTPLLATLIYACGIAGLFYLDRDNSVRTSKALWLPVLYLWVLGSRPVSFWLGVSPPSGASTQLDGSPVDGAFFLALLIVALCVLFRRGQRTLTFLKTNKVILIYFLFCLVSIIWSDFPGVAIKRWVKAIGDLAMILIVLTDERPVAALRRVFSRVGFVLMPLSLLFIKYYPYLGRSYDSWTGFQTNTGLTSDKNMLGVITFVLSLGALWRVLDLLWADDTPPHRGRHLLAQGTLLAFGISLLISANSVTSLVSFVLGAGLMLTTRLQFMRRKPAAVHVLVLLLVVSASALILFGGRASVASALGRNANLARMDIWEAIIPMAPNALIGAGFESFWLGTRVEKLAVLFPNLGLNEAHDGYIEVYLELGWVGLSLIALLWIDGYRRAVKAFRLEPALGGLLLAYILTAVTYNVTEAGFRMLDPLWIFFLLAVVEASSIASGVRVGEATRVDPALGRMPGLAPRNGLAIGPDRPAIARKIVQRRTA
jgi:exopolysaccharide production protein ExoQ